MSDVAVILSPNWDKLAKRYGRVTHNPTIVRAGIIQAAMDEGQRTAIEEIDRLVYMAPPPPSAAGHEAEYLRRNRTNRTRKAIKKDPVPLTVGNSVSGKVFVDPAEYQGLAYYAKFLDRGTGRMKARPFWNNTRALMRVKFRALGPTVLKQFKNDLKVG